MRKKVDYSVYGISLGSFPAEACTICGEAFFDEKTALRIEALEKAKGLFGISVKSKIGYSGNALVIRIPQKIAAILNISEGKEIIIHPEGKEKLSVELI